MVDLSLVSWNTPFSDIHQSDIYEHQSDILNLLSTYQSVAEYERHGPQEHHKFNYDDNHHPVQIYKFMEENYPLHNELGILFQYRHSLPPMSILSEIKRIKPSKKELYEFKENIHRRIEHISWFNILKKLNLKNIFEFVSMNELNKHIYDSIMEKQHLIKKLPLHKIYKVDKKQSAIKSKPEPEKKKPEKKEPEKKKSEKRSKPYNPLTKTLKKEKKRR